MVNRNEFLPLLGRWMVGLCLILVCLSVSGGSLCWAAPASKTIPAKPPVVIEHLEQQYFGKTFNGESTEARLSRLEQFVFGEAVKGKTIQARAKALEPYDEAPEPVEPATAASPSSVGTSSQPVASESTPKPGETSYPAVEDMEMRVFKQRFPNKPLEDRLAALEKQVFHQPMQGSLQDRSDRLQTVILQPTGGPPVASNNYTPAGAAMSIPPSQYGGGQYAPSPSTNPYLVNQVTQIEQQVFSGQTFPADPLPQRVDRLEQQVFQSTAPELSIEDRVQRLGTVVTAQASSKQEVARRGGFGSPYPTGSSRGGIVIGGGYPSGGYYGSSAGGFGGRSGVTVHRGGSDRSRLLMMMMMMVMSAL